MPNYQKHKTNFGSGGFFNRGQTLIETLVAAFILVMGVTAAVGLAIYAFNSSSGITKQIIGNGLAREGIEAVKNIRDTNWLQDTLSTDCYNYVTTNNDGKCYKNWLNIITPPLSLRVNDSSAGSDLWSIAPAVNNWGLDFHSDPSSCPGNICGFYVASGLADGDSEYYRQIVITEDTTIPFDKDNFHRLKVESRVWWTDRKCPRVQTYSSGMPCSVSIQTNLTNWKDY